MIAAQMEEVLPLLGEMVQAATEGASTPSVKVWDKAICDSLQIGSGLKQFYDFFVRALHVGGAHHERTLIGWPCL
ncbi:hypothetical protein EV131_12341 [Rhizobium laguerreae]|uniref:Uncharacterized protein n=1 Tax=Rhizobium laguerreae TaxID=1076926 RepID=A0AAX2QBD6_9HYPH|nr:hypothetical protein EV131_12341 [Rhizobium laguerreae]